jgi:hypothetical protein
MMMGFLRQLFDATQPSSRVARAPQVAGLASLCRGLRSGGAAADLLTAERAAWPRFHLLERV